MPAPTTNRRFYTAIGLLLVLASLPVVVWGDQRAWLLLRNTVALAIGASNLAIPIGTALALLLLRTDLPLRKFFLVSFGALLFIPIYLQAAGWEAGFGRQGWFSFAHGSAADPLLDGWRAAIWIHALAAIPWVMLIVGLGLRLIEPELEDAVLLDGSWVSVLARITIPRVFPFLVAALLWVFVTTGTEITVTDLYQVRTFAEEIYLDVPYVGRINSLDPLRPTAFTQLVFLGCLVVVALMAAGKLAPPEHLPSYASRRVINLRAWRWLALGCLLLMMALMFGVPLGNLIYKAGLQVEQVGAVRVRHWSPAAFAGTVLDSPIRFADEYRWTTVIGAVAAACAVAIAAPLAWLARRGTWRTLPALGMAAICLAVPGPMVGLVVIWLLNREGSDLLIWLYDRSILAPCLAMLVKGLPVTILISWYTFQTVPDKIIESAAVEGANWVVRFWRIGVLQHRLTLGGAWLAAFAVATGDLAASILVIPPGVSTIPVRVFGLLHSGVDDQVAGICLTNVAGFVIIGGLCLAGLKMLAKETLGTGVRDN